MKAKTARKAVRHAKPMRKATRGRKQSHTRTPDNKKATFENVAAESEMIAAEFETPVEFVEMDMEPDVDVIEVIEIE